MPLVLASMHPHTLRVLAKVEKITAAQGITEATFGKRAVNDGKFVKRLRAGRGVTLERLQRAEDYADAHLLETVG